MNAAQNQIADKLHGYASRVAPGLEIVVRAGDVIQLLNALQAAEHAQCVAETRLEQALTGWAEERIQRLLAPSAPLPN